MLFSFETAGFGVEVDSSKAVVSDLACSNTIKFDAVFDHEADQTEVCSICIDHAQTYKHMPHERV